MTPTVYVYIHNGKRWSFTTCGQLLQRYNDGSALVRQSGLGTRRFAKDMWKSASTKCEPDPHISS